jgi:hypothetical protein
MDLSKELVEYLREAGVTETEIFSSNLDARLYHDLGVYGDEAIYGLEYLSKQLNVDLSGFEFDKYFPAEFAGKTKFEIYFYCLFPWLRVFTQNDSGFKPITLAMMERIIQCKTWSVIESKN